MVEMRRRQSPLAGIIRGGDHGVVGDEGPRVVVAERLGLGLLNLAGPDDEAFFDAVREVIGFDLPKEPNTASASETRVALWTGPGSWLIAFNENAAEAIVDSFRDIPCGGSVAVADLSHGRTVIRIGGGACRDVLAKGCAIDFHPRRFLAGDCAQTNLAGISILIHAVTDEPVYDLFVPRGFALSAWEWLLDAALEFGCRVEAEA